MEVRDQVEGGWFLLGDDDHHYLAVNCHLPLVDITILLRLDPEEEAELHALGRTFTDHLAAKVAYWPERYRPRDLGLDRALSAEVDAAVTRWRAAGHPGRDREG